MPNDLSAKKIYIASSWKNAEMAYTLACHLRELKYEVDVFVDSQSGRYVFSFDEVGNRDELNAVSMLQSPKAQRAFREDKKWLDWSDCCILLLPAGNSAHLEAGYIKGQKKKLIIYAPLRFPKGKWDVMYGFADLMTEEIDEIESFLRRPK